MLLLSTEARQIQQSQKKLQLPAQKNSIGEIENYVPARLRSMIYWRSLRRYSLESSSPPWSPMHVLYNCWNGIHCTRPLILSPKSAKSKRKRNTNQKKIQSIAIKSNTSFHIRNNKYKSKTTIIYSTKVSIKF